MGEGDETQEGSSEEVKESEGDGDGDEKEDE